MVTKHSFCHKLPCATNQKTSFKKVKQLVAFRKVILLKPVNEQRHHQKLCACLLWILKFKVTATVLALFVGRHCLYARCATFFLSILKQIFLLSLHLTPLSKRWHTALSLVNVFHSAECVNSIKSLTKSRGSPT